MPRKRQTLLAIVLEVTLERIPMTDGPKPGRVMLRILDQKIAYDQSRKVSELIYVVKMLILLNFFLICGMYNLNLLNWLGAKLSA